MVANGRHRRHQWPSYYLPKITSWTNKNAEMIEELIMKSNTRIKNYNSINDIVSNPTYTVSYLANPIQESCANNDNKVELLIKKSIIMTRITSIMNEFIDFQKDNNNDDSKSIDIDRSVIIDGNDIESGDNNYNNESKTNDSSSIDNDNNNSLIDNNKNNIIYDNNSNNRDSIFARTIKRIFSYNNGTILALALALVSISIIILIYLSNYFSISWTIIFVSMMLILIIFAIISTFTLRYQLLTNSNFASIIDTDN